MIDGKKQFDSISSFEFAMKAKPILAIENLITHFSGFGTPFTLEEGERFFFGDKNETSFIIFLTVGCITAYHSKTDMHVAMGEAPSVMGMADALYYETNYRHLYYLSAESYCEGFRISADDFIERCYKLKLWHDVSKIIAHRVMRLSYIADELIGEDAYGAVRNIINELWHYPEAIRIKLNIAEFIQKRSGLSRSRVMDILSALKKGGYIETKAGKLMAVIKLPKKY